MHTFIVFHEQRKLYHNILKQKPITLIHSRKLPPITACLAGTESS